MVRAVDNVDIEINEMEVLAVVGESGAGKTTLGRLLCTLETPSQGEIFFMGEKVENANLERIRRQTQMVFQNPMESLNPRMSIKDIVIEPLEKLHIDKNERVERLTSSLSSVGLDPSEFVHRRPRDLSGGQRQRVAVARAIISNPRFIVLDEPTSALDASIQAQVLNLLVDLHEKYGFTYLLVTHNISIARYMADRITVMYAGKIVEVGPASDTIDNPKHPYTQALLKSVPNLAAKGIQAPHGETASVLNPPSGCRYHPRCPYVMDICKNKEPELVSVDGSSVACWLNKQGGMEKENDRERTRTTPDCKEDTRQGPDSDSPVLNSPADQSFKPS
jgi:peptide/nickel transport system ATP-binding protein